jgi:putative SOS response-associated peptidase YedK
MCGRFAVTTDPALLAAKIHALDEASSAAVAGPNYNAEARTAGPNYNAEARTAGPNSNAEARTAGPNYNVAPTTTIATVVSRHGDSEDVPTRRVRLMRWGLIPPWVKAGPDGAPDNKGPLLINARADKLTTSPAFRGSAKNKRCLVPMDGWYEWRAPEPGGRGGKTPFFLHRDDGEPLFMAGLWSVWRPHEGAAALLSCTIITTDAVGQLAQVHDRMPLMLDESDWDRWMDPDRPIDGALLRPSAVVERVQLREVSRLVNNVRNNGPELLLPAQLQPEQATLL